MTRAQIEERAAQVLRDHKLLSVPVDPLQVAKALGIKVMNAVFAESGKSGAIVKRGEKFSIFVNANDSPGRKRFTIAHEIGHKLLHMSTGEDSEFVDTEDNFRSAEPSDDPGWTRERTKEWEANAFASALLMNRELVMKIWTGIRDPALVAWKFQVTEPAMAVRLTQLGLINELS
ncbi:MAG TPA: ImmA/IrrE family metallo-endopeptidase [Verrucomicrobiae bacterium]|nr:ImmA/IrrE family metallo-endopeptidase [Verrucomicrobiae bacterium]